MIHATVLKDSVNYLGVRLTTMELTYPRFIHAELMTHRAFSRNAASNRAIPTKKLIDSALDFPTYPISLGKNRPGMQPGDEIHGWRARAIRGCWWLFTHIAALEARTLAALGLHKQWANRWLEPAQHIHVIVSSTDWANFFKQRCDQAAQGEMRELAEQMRSELIRSKPRPLDVGEWHMPYVTDVERADFVGDMDTLARISAARCARVSYLNHRGKRDLQADIDLARRLRQDGHLSPFEHVARPTLGPSIGNFGRGWEQLRHARVNRDLRS